MASGLIDLNCEAGEAGTRLQLELEAECLRHATSASIACAFHAGNPSLMARRLEQCRWMDVAAGAHPGLPRQTDFGRRRLFSDPEQVRHDLLYQVGALDGLARAQGVALTHVKLHDALLTAALARPEMAQAVIRALQDLNPALILVAPAGSALYRQAREQGLSAAAEVQPRRGYRPDGTPVDPAQPGALIPPGEPLFQRALQLAREGVLEAVDGSRLELPAHTLRLPAGTEPDVEQARLLRRYLEQEGVSCQPLPRVLAG